MSNLPGHGPDGVLCIRIVAAGQPDAAVAVEHVHRLVEDQPQAAKGIRPEVADEDAVLAGQGGIMAVEHQHGIGPGVTIVVADGEHEERIWAVPAGHPAGPEPSARRALDADGHPN